MNSKNLTRIICGLSIICLITKLHSFYNIAIISDEFNTSPDIIYGSDFWLLMEWATLGFLALIALLSGVSLFSTLKK